MNKLIKRLTKMDYQYNLISPFYDKKLECEKNGIFLVIDEIEKIINDPNAIQKIKRLIKEVKNEFG